MSSCVGSLTDRAFAGVAAGVAEQDDGGGDHCCAEQARRSEPIGVAVIMAKAGARTGPPGQTACRQAGRTHALTSASAWPGRAMKNATNVRSPSGSVRSLAASGSNRSLTILLSSAAPKTRQGVDHQVVINPLTYMFVVAGAGLEPALSGL